MSKNYFSRLHFSIRSNVKVGMISDQAFRMYINLLTLNGDGSVDRNPPGDWIARQCGVAASEAVSLKAMLSNADLLVGNTWEVKNYNDRQYKDPAKSKYDNRKRVRKSEGNSDHIPDDVEVEVEVSNPILDVEGETHTMGDVKANRNQMAYVRSLLRKTDTNVTKWKKKNGVSGPLMNSHVDMIVSQCAKGEVAEPKLTRELIGSLEFEFNDGGKGAAQYWISHQKQELGPLLHKRLSLLVERDGE